MLFQAGYVYHIKNEYFDKVQDSKLMVNYENGNCRPTYYCMKDEKTSLLWVVPMSTRAEKYQAIYERQIEQYGECIKIVIGEYDGKKCAYLLQNMFPITEEYIDHIHTKNGNPVPVRSDIQKIISDKMIKIKRLLSGGARVVFPDVSRLEKLMVAELAEKNKHEHYEQLKENNGIFRKYDSVVDKDIINKIIASTDCEPIALSDNKTGIIISKKDENILDQIEAPKRQKTL